MLGPSLPLRVSTRAAASSFSHLLSFPTTGDNSRASVEKPRGYGLGIVSPSAKRESDTSAIAARETRCTAHRGIIGDLSRSLAIWNSIWEREEENARGASRGEIARITRCVDVKGVIRFLFFSLAYTEAAIARDVAPSETVWLPSASSRWLHRFALVYIAYTAHLFAPIYCICIPLNRLFFIVFHKSLVRITRRDNTKDERSRSLRRVDIPKNFRT